MFSSCIRCLHVHVNHSKKCFRVRAFSMDLKKWAGLEVGWWWWTVLNNYVPEWKTVLNNYVPEWTTVLNYVPECATLARPKTMFPRVSIVIIETT